MKRVVAAPDAAFKRFRLALGLSQEDIGAARDVGRSAVQGVERSGAGVQLDTLQAYAAPFKVDVRVSFVATCEVCGRRSNAWRVFRFKNVAVLLCSHCDAYQSDRIAPCSICDAEDEFSLCEHVHVPMKPCGDGHDVGAPCGYVPGHRGAHEPFSKRKARGFSAKQWSGLTWGVLRAVDDAKRARASKG